MITIARIPSALHLDLPRFGTMGAGATGSAGCAGTMALSEGGSTSPCLTSMSCDGLDGADVSVLSLLMFGCLSG